MSSATRGEYDGMVYHGWRSYKRRVTDGPEDMTLVAVTKENRFYRATHGYEPLGPARPLTVWLTRDDARYMRNLLDEWLEETSPRGAEKAAREVDPES